VKRRLCWVVAVGLNVQAATAFLAAHHSFNMEYDDKKPVTLSGVVTKIEWANPHVRFYLDVRDSGQVTTWELTMPSTLQLLRRGWTPRLLVVGETVTADAFRARDGSSLANVWLVTLKDGRKVPTGTPVDQAPVR
jgi:Family of unknown function (DUF6152)